MTNYLSLQLNRGWRKTFVNQDGKGLKQKNQNNYDEVGDIIVSKEPNVIW